MADTSTGSNVRANTHLDYINARRDLSEAIFSPSFFLIILAIFAVVTGIMMLIKLSNASTIVVYMVGILLLTAGITGILLYKTSSVVNEVTAGGSELKKDFTTSEK